MAYPKISLLILVVAIAMLHITLTSAQNDTVAATAPTEAATTAPTTNNPAANNTGPTGGQQDGGSSFIHASGLFIVLITAVTRLFC